MMMMVRVMTGIIITNTSARVKNFICQKMKMKEEDNWRNNWSSTYFRQDFLLIISISNRLIYSLFFWPSFSLYSFIVTIIISIIINIAIFISICDGLRLLGLFKPPWKQVEWSSFHLCHLLPPHLYHASKKV